MGKPVHESATHREAFELWYALGADRSLSEVARRIKNSACAVSGWSQAFGWQRRLAHREKVVAELVSQKAVEDEAQSRANALKLCRAVQMRFAEALRDKTAQISAGDFEKAVKLELLLRGKADSRSELVLGGPVFERFVELLIAVVEREVADPVLRGKLAIGFSEAAAGIGAGDTPPTANA